MNCKFCERICGTKNSLINHERLCKKNPDRQCKNMDAARKVATRPVNCQFCERTLPYNCLSKHERGCLENPNNPNIKYCPICNKKFKGESVTCSCGCANTYFRTGSDHPNWKEESYRSTCFASHRKECVICKESNIVEVHHFDENKKNYDRENLIPLCPTHHQYWHSNYKYLILNSILEYIQQRQEGDLS